MGLKRQKIEYKISWEIIRKTSSYKPGAEYCNLCISEAIFIAFPREGDILINSRDEIIKKCRHRDKYKLAKIL